MTALVGRKVTFAPNGGGISIAGIQTKDLSINNEPIDITSDDDSGWRTLLTDDPQMRSIDLSIKGVAKDAALISFVMGGGGLLSDYSLELDGLGTLSGDFHVGSIEIGMDHKDAVTFTSKLSSSGEMSWTPA